MKVTWKGEDGAPDAIELVQPETGKKFKFRAGKAVDVPNVWGSTLVLGNPYFEGDAPADADKPAEAPVKPVDPPPPAPPATKPAATDTKA